jgi:lycopene cyclase CruP
MSIAAKTAVQFPVHTFADRQRVDNMWQNLDQGQIFQPEMVVSGDEYLKTIDVYMAIAGITLGISLERLYR